MTSSRRDGEIKAPYELFKSKQMRKIMGEPQPEKPAATKFDPDDPKNNRIHAASQSRFSLKFSIWFDSRPGVLTILPPVRDPEPEPEYNREGYMRLN